MAEQKKIMIVDDCLENRFLFCYVLKEIDASFHCCMAYDGNDALSQLRQMDGDLPIFIFLDLSMPDMGGKECLSLLKKDEKFSDIPVIIYTSSKLQKDIDDAYRLGASYFLTKSEDLDGLRDGISQSMEMAVQYERTDISPRLNIS
jgi:CheY-like chemotaxis protein